MIESVKNLENGAELLYEKMPYKIKGSIIVCAGGGYVWLSPREEWPVARAFAAGGYQTYVLKYSVGTENAPLNTTPLEQLAWAVSTVRQMETSSSFVGVCGFSAGGHVCASLGVHWDDPELFAENKACRPDAMILGYSATSVLDIDDEQFNHILYGNSETMKNYLQTGNYINALTPPAFIWHTISDKTVPVKMSIEFAEKLIACGVKTELHLFPTGSHGLSLATPDVDDPEKKRFADAHVAMWMPLCLQWLEKEILGKE